MRTRCPHRTCNFTHEQEYTAYLCHKRENVQRGKREKGSRSWRGLHGTTWPVANTKRHDGRIGRSVEIAGPPPPARKSSLGWVSLPTKPRIHPVYVGTEGFRIDRRPGGPPRSDWPPPRLCCAEMFPPARDKEGKILPSCLALASAAGLRATRPKRAIDEEGGHPLGSERDDRRRAQP